MTLFEKQVLRLLALIAGHTSILALRELGADEQRSALAEQATAAINDTVALLRADQEQP